MARLFAKDYHNKSTSWYFNQAVIVLEKDDLWFWKTRNEEGNYQIRFFPVPQKREYFTEYVDIVFNPETELIISHNCSQCNTDESCRHYLSVLRYAYLYLSTRIFEEDTVETCDGNALAGDELWLNLARNAKLYVEGIYNPETDKIRFYHNELSPLDPVLIGKLYAQEEITDISERQVEYYLSNLSAFWDEELNLFSFLNKNRAAYSRKSKFWSIYKKDFAAALLIMQKCRTRFIVKETGEELIFQEQTYPLALRIEPAGTNNYSLRAVVVDELSVWFTGNPSWLFFRNRIYKIYLPFRKEVVDNIFSSGEILSTRDLVYYRCIVHRELHEQNIYLDFEDSIVLPEIVDETPLKRLHIKKLGDKVLVGGSLAFSGEREIPLSVLRFQKPLIHSKYVSPAGEGNAWFHLSPELYEKTQELLEKLPEPELNRLEEYAELVFSGEERIEQLRTAIFNLSDEDWDIQIDPELQNYFISKIPLQVEIIARTDEDIDWFTYEVRYRYRDLNFTHEELKRFFRSKEEFLHTAEGRIVFISNPQVFYEVEELISHSEQKADKVYRSRLMNLPYYLRLREENPAFRMLGDEWLEGLYDALLNRHLKTFESLPLYLQTVLRGYQKAGVAWIKMLAHYHLNGILADEMGLGKTIQALSAILSTTAGKVSLVICPKTLLYNWAAEIDKFHTNIPYAIVDGNKETRIEILSNPNVRLFIMSYSMVLGDIAYLKNMEFEWIVLDEAQNIKNVSAQRTSAIKKLNSKHRLALTGTPIENNLTELWSIFDFLNPGYLGTLNKFKQNYLPAEGEIKARLSLQKMVAPFLLRRVKKEVLLELPDKQEQISWCKLNTLQEKLYLQILDMVHKKLLPEGQEMQSYIHILAALTKLRQVCNHPHLANSDILAELEASSKLEQLLELVTEATNAGHKVLVFSQFVQMLSIIRKVFDAHSLSYSYLDGQTKDRVTPIKRFETNPDIKLFLISLKAGGTGLNLTAADTVILYDPWWNPMVENQAIDRTHRIGQTQKVQVFRLITKGTVEEKILQLQESKRELFDTVIEGGQNMIKAMTKEDIKSLFSYSG
ncbi:MAG TPA: DEAD/DEAH box helicase [Candidatus Cloacimonas sp.]|nr:DEAD/DEAH box helicase [Candidatus Cloacimonas sp.]HPK59923.1 DEAD/DEAH box helicase [Candidatus Cloacimonas sp.]HPV63812.1 DEAD/DEAH box helicase [Candidatus Cloacimonas sp.]